MAVQELPRERGVVYYFRGKRIRIAAAWDCEDRRAMLADPDSIAAAGRQILKTDTTTTLWLAPVAGERWVIKRYNTRSIWHTVKRALRRTRAANCWRMAGQYLACGISTAPPVALIEERHSGFAGKSWFVNVFVEGTLLSDLLRDRPAFGDLEPLADSVAVLFEKLKLNRLSHGDMKATNILVVDGALFLLDLDAAQSHRWGWSHRRALNRDRRRFLQNWANQPQIQHGFAARLSARSI